MSDILETISERLFRYWLIGRYRKIYGGQRVPRPTYDEHAQKVDAELVLLWRELRNERGV